MVGTPCATTHPRECPYNEHAPLTVDGRAAWGAFCAPPIRLTYAGLGSCTGVDSSGAERRLIAAGIEPEIAEDLLAACETGLLSAFADDRKRKQAEDDRQD